MLVKQINVVGTQSLEGSLDGFTNVFGSAVGTVAFAFLEVEAELRRDHDLIALAGQGATEQIFVGEGTVDFGGVEESATELDRPMQCRDGFGFVCGTVGLAHTHAAQTHSRHLESLMTEFSCA